MHAQRSPITIGLLVAIAVVALQALLVPLFAGPAANIGPRDLPIAVAGPPPATQALVQRLTTEHPGAFEIQQVSGGAALDDAIRDRDVYGGIVVTPAGAEVHVASAAGPTVSTLLSQAAAGLQAPVRDVVPVHSGDLRGTGFGAGFLPLAITSLLAGVLIFFAVRSRGARLTALVTFGVLAGFGGGAVLQYWLDVLPGDYLVNAAALGLFSLAVAATMTGLGAVLDRAGLALGALTVFLVGNALSAVSSAPELLPQPWGVVGQWLPIGSGATLLRSVAYFDGNGGGTAALILATYAVAGLALAAIGGRGLARRPAAGEVAGPPAGRVREAALAG
jgi:hypothetical protein